ncbi:hypothetical protein C7N43_02800 [Sphingobacteriales bacterium UPWRP_1]|nr:hypothetical protein BVG80_09310 [Sphingobacteriales bacterium TSM_CSM]PSJ78550.1 hypothetical protein C7N43_02800 [Sphingobacteriales bacterium UPWRP_1]
MNNLQFFITCWQKELKRTMVALKALPSDMSRLQYRPHEKSRSAIEIIGHILPHAEDLLKAVDTMEIAEHNRTFDSIAEACEYYQTNSQLLMSKLQLVDEQLWENGMVLLTADGIILYEGIMMNLFWDLLFDTIHHRGQLTTYYRAMGAPNPSVYGPTAEGMESFMAAAILKSKTRK